jgi:mannose-6-phosphate isomerase-like protein (cupin superfamily)
MGEHANIFIANIEKDTIQNKFYRKVLYTTNLQQMVLMSVKPKEDISFEIHSNNDQFIRIEKGLGILYIGPKKESSYKLSDGVAVTIPANTWHQIVNTSDTDDLKLYTIYSPPHYPPDKIDINRPDQCHNMQGGINDHFKNNRKNLMY